MVSYMRNILAAAFERPSTNTLRRREDIHGQIHVLTGGSGQMSRVAVASFDPIFW